MAKLVLKKALFNKSEVLKRGGDVQQLEKFRKLILDHLSTLDDGKPGDDGEVKKAFSKMILILKAGLPVGTIHTYKDGKKYIKSPSGKWIPKYDSHTRGAKMAIAAIRRKIAAAPDAQTMMQIILENRDRFSDEQGRPLPFVQELSKYVAGEQDRREQEVKRQRKEKQDSRKKAGQQAKNTPQESKAVQPKDEREEGQEKTPETEKKQAAEQAGGKQGDGAVEPDKGKKQGGGSGDGGSGDDGSGTDLPKLTDNIHVILHGTNAEKEKLKGKFFHIANTPDFMKQYGLDGDFFEVKYGVVTRHYGKDADHALTEQNWKDIAKQITDPFAISKYKDGYRLFVNIKINEKFVAIGVDVKTTGEGIEVNTITTAFGYKGSTESEEVLYRSKKTTPDQAALLDGLTPSLPPDQASSKVSPESGEKSSDFEKIREKHPDQDKGKKGAKVTDKKGRLKPGTRMTGAEWKENGYKTYDKNGLSREMRDDCFYTADAHNGLYEAFEDFKARDKRTEGTISGSEEVTAETGKLYQEVLKIAYDGRIPTFGEIELTRKIYENHDIGEITGLLARGKFVALRPGLNDNVLYVDENGDEATTNYNLLDDESQKKLQAALRQYIKTKQSIQKSISNVIDFFRNLQVGKGPRFVKKAVSVRGADGAVELSERWVQESIESIAPYVEEAGISETGKKVVAVDFDGVINSYLSGWKGPTETDEPVLSAAESLKTLYNRGYKVVIFSTRANTQEGIDTIREYLRKHTENSELADSIEITDQKPIADMYIDDRAIPFNGDWEETLKKIEEFKPWTEKSLTYSGYPLQGRTKIQGMDISIENKKGSIRSGTDKDGHDWSIKMNLDYGYIRGTVGKDKDHVDCVAPDTKILMGDYTEKPAKEIKAGDMLVASQENPEKRFGQRKQMPSRVVWTETGRRKMFKFVLADGREIKTTAGHLHYIFRGKSRDKIWKRADELKTGHELVSIYNPTNMVENEEYKKGYLYGAYKGDGSLSHDGTQVYCDIAKGIYGYPVIERIKLFWSDLGLETASIHIEEPRNTATEIDPGRIINSVMRIAKLSIRGSKKVHFAKQILTMESLGSADWCRGYLAGFFDTDGCLNVNKEAQICQTKDQALAFSTISKAMDFIGFKSKVRGNSIFLSGDWNADNVALQFTQTLKPALFKKRNFTGQALRYERVKIINIEEYEGEFVAIQTEIGTYIANGLFTHNCYIGPNPEAETVFIVHQNDPATGEYDEDKVMLGFDSEDEARKAYLSQYDRPGFLGDIDEMDIETFKETAFDPANKGKKLA